MSILNPLEFDLMDKLNNNGGKNNTVNSLSIFNSFKIVTKNVGRKFL